MLPDKKQNQKKETHPVSRRDALKAVVVAAGVATLSNLPDKWQTPVIDVGVLPAHAQISGLIFISNLTSTFTGTNDCNFGVIGSTRDFTFDYDDPSGQVTSATIVDYTYIYSPSNFVNHDAFPLGGPKPAYVLNITRVGDGFKGTITLKLCTQFASNNTIQDTVFITNAASSVSNVLTISTNKPPGAQGATPVVEESAP